MENEGQEKENTPLTFEEILQDKEYQREYDKRVQKAIDKALAKKQTDSDNEQIASLLKEVGELKDTLLKNENAKKDASLTKDIKKVFGDKKFVNDYTENAIINEIKGELQKADNKKDITTIFNEITKDKAGIFENPNKAPEIPGASDKVETKVSKEAFSKMGYKERLKLKEENPELFSQLNTE